MEELVIDSASICWAFHSDCQDNLLDSFLPNASSWQEMQAVGVGLWLTDASQLRTRVSFSPRPLSAVTMYLMSIELGFLIFIWLHATWSMHFLLYCQEFFWGWRSSLPGSSPSSSYYL